MFIFIFSIQYGEVYLDIPKRASDGIFVESIHAKHVIDILKT